jgi:transposase
MTGWGGLRLRPIHLQADVASSAAGHLPTNRHVDITRRYGVWGNFRPVGIGRDSLAHKRAEVGVAIDAAGARLLYLPPYSPDLTPVEMAFAKLKAAPRKAATRSIEALIDAIALALTAQECLNQFAAAGYDRV